MGKILDAVAAFIGFYVPPPDGSDQEKLMTYRWATSIGLIGTWVFFGFAVCWVLGYTPLPTIAWASDLDKVTAQIASSQVDQKHMSSQISELIVLQVKNNIGEQLKASCLARAANNQADLDSANNQLGTLSDRYQELTGHGYHLQSCDTILVQSK